MLNAAEFYRTFHSKLTLQSHAQISMDLPIITVAQDKICASLASNLQSDYSLLRPLSNAPLESTFEVIVSIGF